MAEGGLKLHESFISYLERARKLLIMVTEDWEAIKEESAIADIPLKLRNAIESADNIYREHRTILDSESALKVHYRLASRSIKENFKTLHRAVRYYCFDDERTRRICRTFPINGPIASQVSGTHAIMMLMSESTTPIPEGVVPYGSVEDFDLEYNAFVGMITDCSTQLLAQKELTVKRDLAFRELRAVIKMANDAARFRFRNDSERKKRYGR